MRLIPIVLLLLSLTMQAQSRYARFPGQVTVITDEAIKYDNELLLLYNIDPKLRPIFEMGLLYPALFRATPSTAPKEIAHKITISEFKILPPTSPKVKAFQFVVLQTEGIAPQLYDLELVNTHGNWKMDIATFVRGSYVATLRKR